MNDHQLLEACLLQDPQAQKRLYEKYCGAMYGLALRLLNDEQLAQDALQEAFIDVFKDLNAFAGRSTLGAWIRTIVVRKSLLRLKLERSFLPIDEVEESGAWAWPTFPDDMWLHDWICALPDGYRAVFTLVEIEGYAHREVARMLDISEGTSKSQLYHARKKLKEKWKQMEQL